MKLETEITLRHVQMLRDHLAREMRALDTEIDYELELWAAMDLLNKALDAAMVLKPIPQERIRCHECYAFFERPVGLRGRRPKFCSDACRQRAYRRNAA